MTYKITSFHVKNDFFSHKIYSKLKKKKESDQQRFETIFNRSIKKKLSYPPKTIYNVGKCCLNLKKNEQ